MFKYLQYFVFYENYTQNTYIIMLHTHISLQCK
nr:MAG TPA: hypothetical protein [Caudoviricetes sp.]